jgi:hypothetical protein
MLPLSNQSPPLGVPTKFCPKQDQLRLGFIGIHLLKTTRKGAEIVYIARK